VLINAIGPLRLIVIFIIICHHVRDQVPVILSLDGSSPELFEILKIILSVQLVLAVKNNVFKTVIISTPIKIIIILSLKGKNDFPFVQKKIVLHFKRKSKNCLGF